jgi:hypothetical protein
MTHRTRYFLVGSGLIVVVGLCTGLVAYYTGHLPFGAGSRGPAELAYVPPDTAAIAYADVRHIMDSEFRKRVRSLIPTGEGKERLLAQTGIDVERDIDSVVATLGDGDNGQQKPIVFVRGRFQPERIEALAREHGGTTEEYRGKRLVVESAGNGSSDFAIGARPVGQGGLAFLEPNLLAFGSMDRLKSAIDAAATHQSVASTSELMKLVGGVSSGDAWVVGRFETLAGDARMAPAMRNQLSALQWFSLSADVDQSIVGRVHAQAKDAQSGEQIRSVINGMLGAARLLTNQDQRVTTALSSVQASGVGPDIDLSFSVPADVIDMVSSAAQGTMGGVRRQ